MVLLGKLAAVTVTMDTLTVEMKAVPIRHNYT